MADQRITDLSSIGTLATGDLFVVTDQSQGDIAKNASIDILASYVRSTVPSSARAFGGNVNEISTWAEGNSTEVIPASKLPAASVPDLSNYVTLDTTQVITGIKNFTNLRSNSQEVVTIGNTQTITGAKNFTNITVNGSSIPTLVADNTWTGDNVFSNSTIFSDTSTDGSIQVDSIFGIGDINTGIDFNGNDRLQLQAAGFQQINLTANNIRFNNGLNAVNYEFSTDVAPNYRWMFYDSSNDSLEVNASSITGVAGSETGTWTPAWTNAGVIGTTTATYSKSGQNVIAHCEIEMAAGADTFLFLNNTSLPFSIPADSRDIGIGTYFTSASQSSLAASTSGVVAGVGSVLLFLDNTVNTYLRADDIRGYIGFTVTYRTDD